MEVGAVNQKTHRFHILVHPCFPDCIGRNFEWSHVYWECAGIGTFEGMWRSNAAHLIPYLQEQTKKVNKMDLHRNK